MQYRLTLPERDPNPIRYRRSWIISGDTPDKARAAFRKEFGKKLKLKADERIDVQEGEADDAPLAVAKDAQTKVTTFNDSQFIRTALELGRDGRGPGGSVDILVGGKRVAQINFHAFFGEDAGERGEGLIIDVIDVEDRFSDRRALGFPRRGEAPEAVATGSIVSADLWTGPKKAVKKKGGR